MRFRLGAVVGFGAGYVLGAKAGRERYHQIEAMWHKAMRTQPARQLQSEVRQTVSAVGEAVERKTSDGVAQVAETLNQARDRVNQTGEQQAGSHAM